MINNGNGNIAVSGTVDDGKVIRDVYFSLWLYNSLDSLLVNNKVFTGKFSLNK